MLGDNFPIDISSYQDETFLYSNIIIFYFILFLKLVKDEQYRRTQASQRMPRQYEQYAAVTDVAVRPADSGAAPGFLHQTAQ